MDDPPVGAATKRCPHCASDIPAEAVVCRHCQRDTRITPAELDRQSAEFSRRLAQPDYTWLWWFGLPLLIGVGWYLLADWDCRQHGLVFAQNIYGVWGCWRPR